MSSPACGNLPSTTDAGMSGEVYWAICGRRSASQIDVDRLGAEIAQRGLPHRCAQRCQLHRHLYGAPEGLCGGFAVAREEGLTGSIVAPSIGKFCETGDERTTRSIGAAGQLRERRGVVGEVVDPDEEVSHRLLPASRPCVTVGARRAASRPRSRACQRRRHPADRHPAPPPTHHAASSSRRRRPLRTR